MFNYANVALNAVKYMKQRGEKDPKATWKRAVKALITSLSSPQKGYPRPASFAVCLVAIIMLAFGCSSVPPDPSWITLDEAIQETVAQVEAKLAQGVRVAIVNFDSPSAGMSDYTMEEIAGALVNAGMTVADRSNMAYVYKELNFQMSGMVSDKTAQAVGKFLGAQSVITGQLIDAGNFYRFRVNSINVESATREVSVMLNVLKSRQLTDMLAALETNKLVSKSADYALAANTVPTTAGAFLDQGITFSARGNFTTAVESFTGAVKLELNNAAAYYNRGSAYDSKGDYDRAIEDYNRAIKLDQNDAIAYYNRGSAYDSKGDYDRAIADFSRALKIDPNDATAYNNRGSAYGSKGDYDRAIDDFSRAIKLDPNFATAYNNRGFAYRNKGDYYRAIEDYNRAIKLDPNFATAYNNRGSAYDDSKEDYDRAIEDYNRAIKLDPNDATAYNNRGSAYDSKGDYDRAIEDYNRAIKLDPNFATAYNNRGFAYRNKGDYYRAIADFTQAVKLDPDDASAKSNLEFARRRGR
jgi:tetratricopeptide (TPR) repeat protein